MDFIGRQYVTARHVATAYVAGALGRVCSTSRGDTDRGQASTEYAGILFVIVAIIGALIGLGFTDVGQAIKDKIVDAVGKIGA
jgi:hypothetical protein